MLKKLLPYILIALIFGLFILIFHKDSLTYRFNPGLVHDYLRSQDIEDPQGLIKDRIQVSDSDIYMATGYLYAGGTDPTKYNFQHPPAVKYLFGFSTLLTGNPYWIELLFGLSLLMLTYFLGTKLTKNFWTAFGATLLLLFDPVFNGMMSGALLDLGQAVFALGYIILVFFFPESWLLQGIVLGLFAASKFWSTAIIILALVWGFRMYLQKEKINFRKLILSFVVAFLIFCLTYARSFSAGNFNIFAFLAHDLRFMLSHNSAVQIGGPVILFLTGFFKPWWQPGVERAADWSILWPLGLISSILMAIRTKITDPKFFYCLVPGAYLLLTVTQVPFTRYFIVILPFVYLSLMSLLEAPKSHK